MDKKIIIGNWKMKLGLPETLELTKAVKKFSTKNVDIAVCPSFVGLSEAANLLKYSNVKLGAQDCFWESEGAYTGEVSASYLKEVGCEFVIIGHSERRQILGETDEVVHKKVKMALEASLTPIICVGETFEERQQGSKDYILIQQTTKALQGIKLRDGQKVLMAYEPVWVIGSGQAIDPAEAEVAHQVIRQSLFDIFSPTLVKNNFSIIYGGSVNGENVQSFTSLANTNGVLVGGASLKADSFKAIIDNI